MRLTKIQNPAGKRLALLGVAAVTTVTLLTACTSDVGSDAASVSAATTGDASVGIEAAMAENHAYWTPTASEDDPAEDRTQITLEGTGATSSSDAVSIAAGTVTIGAGGTYTLTGNFAGQVVVDAGDDEEVTLVLDGADLSADGQAALMLKNAEGVSIVLADGSENSITDSGPIAADASEDAALFSDTDVQISGDGGLTVTGGRADGVASTKDLVIAGGDLVVVAADDGLRGKDALVVSAGSIAVESGGDALKSNNADEAERGYVYIQGGALTLAASQDAIDAETDLLIRGGTIGATSGSVQPASGDEEVSGKGFKSGVLTIVEDGDISVEARDDAVHSNGSVHIAGGTLELASGDDGIHADGALLIEGGTVTVSESVEGLEASALTVAGGDISVTSSDDGLNASNSAATDATGVESAEAATVPAPGDGAPSMEGAAPPAGGAGGGMGGGGFEDDGSTLVISGGTLTVDAEGDGIDSNGSLLISGGDTVVFGTSRGGNGAFDANGDFELSGGTVLAVSAGQMEQGPSTGEQAWVESAVSGSAGAQIEFSSAEGAKLASVVATKDFGYVFFSDGSVTTDATYSISVDGSTSSATAGVATAGGAGGGRPGQPESAAPTTGVE